MPTSGVRGKIVRRKSKHVNTDLVDIPQAVENQKNVTLVADVMFVNGVPFLVSSSRNIMLTTIEHAPDRKVSKFGYLLHWIMNAYARTGFNVRTILMDNEFEEIRDHINATLNTPAASEHLVKSNAVFRLSRSVVAALYALFLMLRSHALC